MPKLAHIQTNCTAGELSPRLLGRVDVAKYQNGLRTCYNAIPLVHGGAKRRPGSRYAAGAKHDDKQKQKWLKRQVNIMEQKHTSQQQSVPEKP